MVDSPDDQGKLLPCPFCGAPAFVHENDWCDPPEWGVYCANRKCRAATTKEEAIAAWNRRTPPSTAGWLPISTAPKDGKPILLGSYDSDEEERPAISTLGWWEDAEPDGCQSMGHDGGFVDHYYGDFMPGRSIGNPKSHYPARQPTHWQPLPPAPSQEGASEGEG